MLFHFSSGSSNGHIEAAVEISHANVRQSSPLDWNEALDIINNATSSEQVGQHVISCQNSWARSSVSLFLLLFGNLVSVAYMSQVDIC